MAVLKLKQVLIGQYEPEDVKAFCLIANTIMETLKLEMAYNKMLEKQPKIEFIEGEKVK